MDVFTASHSIGGSQHLGYPAMFPSGRPDVRLSAKADAWADSVDGQAEELSLRLVRRLRYFAAARIKIASKLELKRILSRKAWRPSGLHLAGSHVSLRSQRSEELPNVCHHQHWLLPERKMSAMGELGVADQIVVALQDVSGRRQGYNLSR
jgi:hypothetical protein